MQNNEQQIRLNLSEQAYVSSCYPLPDRPGLDACIEWKETLVRQVLKKVDQVSITIAALREPFPHLARLALEGYFETMPIRNYFEGLGEGSHNLNLYLFAKGVAKKFKDAPMEIRQKVLVPVLDHVNGCSTKPARIDTGEVWTYQGIEEGGLDFQLTALSCYSPYYLVHGVSTIGHQVMRPLSKDEFLRYTEWFEARQSSKNNPFKYID